MAIDETKRVLTKYTVKTLQVNGDSTSVDTTDSSGFVRNTAEIAKLKVGDEFELETVQYSTITGLKLGDEWLFRKTDEDMKADYDAWLASWKQQQRDELAENRDRWQAGEDALPEWVRARLQSFHKTGGENFELEGWGYELTVAELAVLYYKSKGEESPQTTEYAKKYGTSGHQHGVAKFLAAQHEAKQPLAQVSALAPLTGDNDYSGTKDNS